MMLPFEWWCVWLGDDDDQAQGRGLDCGLKWRLSGVGGVKSMNGDEYRWINLCAIWINWFCIVARWINSSAKRKKVHCSSIGSFKLNQSHSVRGSTAAMLCLQREAISQIDCDWLLCLPNEGTQSGSSPFLVDYYYYIILWPRGKNVLLNWTRIFCRCNREEYSTTPSQ